MKVDTLTKTSILLKIKGDVFLITVYNLSIGKEYQYTCDSKQALISTYAIENNKMSQLSYGNIELNIIETDYFYTYGDLTARKACD